MDKIYKHISQSIATLLFVAMLFSCQGRINKVRQMDEKDFSPQTEELSVHIIYTDSGKVAAKLKSPKLLDYSNLDFPYREFPDGVNVEFYDDKDEKNTVVADYAIIYDETDLVDLRGNVEIVTSDSTVLHSKQLYWDQNKERKWLFTDQEYTLIMNNGTTNKGQGFDSDDKFNNFISRSNTGIHYIEDNKAKDDDK